MGEGGMMTVRELMDALQDADPERVVICQRDSEGNGYSPLASVWVENAVYVPETTWMGEVCYEYLDEELRKAGYSDEDTYTGADGQKAILLVPMN